MNEHEIEKIGLVEWLPVHKHSRVLYLKLRYEDVQMYDLQPGDKLKVKIELLKKGPREPEE